MIFTYTTKHKAARTMKLQILYSVVSVIAFAKLDEVSGNCWDEDPSECFLVNKMSKRNCRRPSTYNACKKSCGAVRCGGDPIYDCYDELPESSCSKPKACEDAPQRCAKTCNLCRKRGDYTCVDLEPEWCKKVGTWKFGCRAKSNYLQCKKTCGAVKCGYGADDCFDELPESNCQKSNACVGGLWSKANHNPAGCKKTCNLCN